MVIFCISTTAENHSIADEALYGAQDHAVYHDRAVLRAVLALSLIHI